MPARPPGCALAFQMLPVTLAYFVPRTRAINHKKALAYRQLRPLGRPASVSRETAAEHALTGVGTNHGWRH